MEISKLRLYTFLFISVVVHGIVLISWRSSTNIVEQPLITMAVQLATFPQAESTNAQARKTKKTVKRNDSLLDKTSTQIQLKKIPIQKLKKNLKPSNTKLEESPEEIKRPAVDNQKQKTNKTTKTKLQHNNANITPNNTDYNVHVIANNYLHRELARYFIYPRIAQRRGWEGKVVLDFRIEPNGYINNIKIAHSSGHGILDRSAVRALVRIGHLYDMVPWLNGAPVEILQFPIIYRLQEG